MGECQSACSVEPSDLTEDAMKQSVKIEYSGQTFILPEVLSFSQPNTFKKVELAAREFCERNNISLFYSALISRIIAYRHDRIFQAVWNKLPPHHREGFLEELNTIEHDLMDSFYHKFVKNGRQKQGGAIRAIPPKMTKQTDISQSEREELCSIGQQMLRAGKVAAIFMCAGSSSRFEGDKFLADLGLSIHSSILDLCFRRLKRNFTSNASPFIVINCNDDNLQAIQTYLKANRYYGLNRTKIRFFSTNSLPVINPLGKYCVDVNLKLIKRPAGTATCAEFLLNSQMQELFTKEGIDYVYFSGMENLLENPCDPLLLGMIKTERRKIAAKCVNSSFYSEHLSRYCYGDDNKTKIELLNSQDFPQLQSQQSLDGLPIALNSMVFSLPSLQQIMQDYRTSLFLAQKYHVIAKEQKIYNVELYQFEQQLCFSFEKDLRDIISCSNDAILLKVSRRRSYIPICSRSKQYALGEAVRHFQQQFQKQLRS